MTMTNNTNAFKQALANQQAQIGLWLSLANAYTSEICAEAGFDWLLLDGEHAPNDLRSMLAQLQAIAPFPASHPIGRIPLGHGEAGVANIKQYLDLGFQTLLVPMVDTPEQAQQLVRATRYPQADDKSGLRGMAGTRASRWGRRPNYAREANDSICLLVQVETQSGLDHLEAIANTPGVDGVFIGPADLSAAIGHPGNATHPEAQATIDEAIRRIVKTGKAAGILTSDETLGRHYLALGATFVAVGLDINILVRQSSALAKLYKTDLKVATPTDKTY